MALSAVLYEYGARLNSGVILLAWVAGVTIPRAAEYFEKRRPAKVAIPLPDKSAQTVSPVPVTRFDRQTGDDAMSVGVRAPILDERDAAG